MAQVPSMGSPKATQNPSANLLASNRYAHLVLCRFDRMPILSFRIAALHSFCLPIQFNLATHGGAMKRRHVSIATVIIHFCFLAANPDLGIAAERTALVIGNSQYQGADALPNPVNDAEMIKNILVDELHYPSGRVIAIKRCYTGANEERDCDASLIS